MALVQDPYVKHINAEELQSLISGVDIDKISSTQQKLWKPKGGSLYVFVVDPTNDPEDWRADGYRWKQNGTSCVPKKQPVFRKIHYFIQTPNKISVAFKKQVVKPLSHPNLVFVQYVGQESAAVDFPHGNSKRSSRNYIPSAPSLRKSLTMPGASFNDLQEQTVVEPQQHQPRSRNQLYYFKKKDSGPKPNLNCKDHVLALNEIAYAAFGLIWHITTFPDLIVVFGLPDLLEYVSYQAAAGRIIMSHETLLVLTNFTLSCISVELSIFPEKRAVPVAFCLHEGNFKNANDIFFSELYNRLNNVRGAVITVNVDSSVASSIKKCCTDWYPVTYWNSIFHDVDSWCKAHNSSKSEAQKYRSQLHELLECSTEDHYSIQLLTFRTSWSTAFSLHYEQQLESCVLHSNACYLNHIGVLKDSVASCPPSESVKAVLARFQDLKDLSADRLVFSIYKLQRYYHSQVKGNSVSFGSYTRPFDVNGGKSLTSMTTSDIDNLMTDIRQKLRDRSDNTEAIPTVISALAEEMTVTHVSAQKAFLVSLPNAQPHLVKLFPRETCSCQSTTTCCHILAVTKSLGLETSERPCINLALMLQKSRSQGSRKRLRGVKRCKIEVTGEPESPEIELANCLVDVYNGASTTGVTQSQAVSHTAVQDHNGYTMAANQVG